jgi:Domain of unknown function DUF29
VENELYWHDILLWSEVQADLLRRLARGERVDGVDWDHVIEEVEDVGRSEWRSVEIVLRHAMVHLLKSEGWPNAQPREHWRSEVLGFFADASERFAQSMRQRIDLERLYQLALKQARGTTIDGQPPGPLPDQCPFTLDALLAGDRHALEEQLARAGCAQVGQTPP